jgi:Mg2+/Co2+ transporter CorB
MSLLQTVLPSLGAVVVLLACSAFFSSSESAIFSLSDEWIATNTAVASPDNDALRSLREDPHRLLVTILVGNNIVNIAISSIVTLLVVEFVPAGIAVVLATLGATTLVLVFGEIVPKSYGLGQAPTWARRVARPISYVELTLTPIVIVFDITTRWLTALVGGDTHIEETYVKE